MARPSVRRTAEVALYACLATAAFAASLAPALPLYARQLGATMPEVGLLAAAPLIVALAAPHRSGAGHALDHHRLTLGATALLCVVPPLCALANAPWQLLGLRALLGLAFWPTPNVVVPDPLARGHGAHGYGALAGWVVGPFFAGLAAERWGPGGSFLVAGACGAIALSILASGYRPSLTSPSDPGPSVRGVAALGPLALGGVATVLVAFLPLYAAGARLGPAQVGALFAAGAVAAGSTRWLGGKVTTLYRPALSVGSIMLGSLACLGLALATGLGALGAALLLFGAAYGGAHAGAHAGADGPDSAIPWAVRVGRAAQALTPPLGGIGILLIGEEAVLLLAGIALAAAAVGVAALTPAPRPVAAPEPDDQPATFGGPA